MKQIDDLMKHYGEHKDIFYDRLETFLSAARNEALEEAASECDDWIQSGPPMSACAKALAFEIRALKIGGDSNDA